VSLSQFRDVAVSIGRRKHVQFMAVAIAVALGVALLTTLQAGIWLAYERQDVPWIGLLKARVVNWFTYAAFMPLLVWLARRWPLGRAGWLTSVPLHLGASLAVALAKETIFVIIGNVFRPGVFHLWEIVAEDFTFEIMTVWALMAVAHALVFYSDRSRAAAVQAEAAPGCFIARTDKGVLRLALTDIESVGAQGNYAQLNTAAGRHLIRETMVRLETRLGAGFVRVHRRAIVNAAKVRAVEPRSHSEYWIVMVSGERVASGRTYAEQVRRLIQ